MLTNLFWSENVFQWDFTSVRRVFKGKKKRFKYVSFLDQVKDKEILTFHFYWELLTSADLLCNSFGAHCIF